jgi:hypothetical protein
VELSSNEVRWKFRLPDPDPRLNFARTFVGSLPMRKLPGGLQFKRVSLEVLPGKSLSDLFPVLQKKNPRFLGGEVFFFFEDPIVFGV